MTAATDLAQLIESITPHATNLRRDLHAHPELMFEEKRTAEIIQRELAQLRIDFVPDLARGTGVLAHIPATETSDTTIGLRADIDALPILEQTGLPHASTHRGVMHACGHDGHTAILLAAARTLAALDHRPNHVTLLFQPAEEGGAGGDLMVKDGALDGSRLGDPVTHLYGLHGWPMMALNTLATRTGPLLASADEFAITVHGRPGHAAMPHLTADPVVAAAHITTALQTISSRNADPVDAVVVSVTDISTPNDASNVIPPSARLIGTVRTLSDHHRDLAQDRLTEIARSVATAMGATAEVDYRRGYPVTTNHADATDRLTRVVNAAFGENTVQHLPAPFMGAEDFSYYCKQVPSCFFLIGLNPDPGSAAPGLHTPHFDFNDAAIPTAVQTFTRLCLEPLAPAA